MLNQRKRRRLLGVADRHAFTHHPLHAQQADAQLILDQLADSLDAPVAQMVDIVLTFDAVVDLDDVSQHSHQVTVGQRAVRKRDGQI